MSENTMNPTEARRQRAMQLKNARNYRYAVNEYNRQVEEQQKAIEQALTIKKLQEEQEKKERQEADFLTRAFSTVGDIASNIVTGALKGLEGIYDLGASAVGAVGGIFSEDFQKNVQKHIAYDFVGENIGKPLQDLTKYSYTNDGWLGETIETVSSGIGQMLPAVAVNIIPVGGTAASMAMIGGMAAGNSTEEAFKDENTNYYRGLGYGIASGVVEGVTEKMFTGFDKYNLFAGKGYLDNLTKNIGKSGLAKGIRQFAEEGIEEATYEFVNPLIQNIYKDKGFFEDFLTEEHLKDVGEAGLLGGLTAFAFGETVGRIGRRAREIQDDVETLDNIDKKEEKLWADGKLDEASISKIREAREVVYQDLSKRLVSAKPEARQRYLNLLDNYGIGQKFDNDGLLVKNQEQVDDVELEDMPTHTKYNKMAYSPILQGREKSLLFEPTTQELSEGQASARKSFVRSKSNEKKLFVITDNSLGKKANGEELESALVDGVLYVNSKADASLVITQHQLLEDLKQTKAYNEYAKYVLKEIADNETLKQRYDDINELYNQTVNAYTEALLQKEYKKGNDRLKKEILAKVENIAQQGVFEQLSSSFASEYLFVDKDAILNLANNETVVARKILSLLQKHYHKLSNGNTEQKKTSAKLQEIIELYNNALEDAYGNAKSLDNEKAKNYNKEKDINRYGKGKRDYSSHYSEERLESRGSVEQTRGLQEESREPRPGENQGNGRKIARVLPREEKAISQVQVRQINHEDWDDFEKKLAKTIKEDLGVDVEYYEGSAVPPGYDKNQDNHFDGFMDSPNKKMYLRSDESLTEKEIVEAANHEGVHYIRSVNPELYQKVEDAITTNIDASDFAELYHAYSEGYSGVYGDSVSKVYEEIAADIISKRAQATFVNLDVVNDAIEEMYKAFNPNAEVEEISSGELRYAKKVERDSNGTPLSPGQSKFFKDSKVRDADGKLKVVYHGTPNGKFFIFDAGKLSDSPRLSQLGQGFYFTDKRDAALSYTKKESGHQSNKSHLFEVYLNIERPLRIDDKERQLERGKLFNIIMKSDYEWFFDNWLPFELDGKEILGKVRSRQEIEGLTKEERVNLWLEFHYGERRDYEADRHILSELVKAYHQDGQGELMANISKEFGIDGIIFENDHNINQYIAFEPNQIKETTNISPTISDDIRFAIGKKDERKSLLKSTIEKDVVKTFGKTTNWKETGYLLQDGTRLDLSGKKDGAPSGQRSVDHREIFDIDEDAEIYGTEAMIDFMGRGNIRVSPEYPGINLQIEPTEQQYNQIRKFIDEFALMQGYFAVDFDNTNGDTVATLEYENNIRSSKIINDIKYYFQEGKVPYKSPLADFRYALTKGQLKKEIAKGTKGKVYNRKDAEEAISNIVNHLNFGDEFYGKLSRKHRSEAVEKLWIAMNTKDAGYRSGAAFEIADLILDNTLYTSSYEESASEVARNTINTLKPYLHTIDLSGIKSEIEHRFDKDTSVYALWGKKKGAKGLNIFDIANELSASGVYLDSEIINEADKFFEIHDIYNNSLAVLRENKKKSIRDFASEDDIKQMRQEIARGVLIAFDKYGEETKLSKMEDKAFTLSVRLKDAIARSKAISNLNATIDRVKGLEKYASAAMELSPEVGEFVKQLKNIRTWRGNLSNDIRGIIRSYAKEVNGKKLYDLIANNEGVANPVEGIIDEIAFGDGELTTLELIKLDKILNNFIHNARAYDRVFFDNRNQSETKLAQKAVEEVRGSIAYQDDGALGKMSKLSRTMVAPVWRFERLNNYDENGIMSKVFKEFQNGVGKQAQFEMQVAKHFESFLKENKKLVEKWREPAGEGIEMSRGQMLSLYMLSLRKQAHSHLFSNEGGTAGVVRVANEKYAAKGEPTIAVSEKGVDLNINQALIKDIESKLSDKEKEFISLAQEFFDKIARDAKQETDIALFGISNVGEENYIPIRVADDQIYKQMGDNATDFRDIFSVYSPSFNKEVKPNSKNKIVVENILDIINRHTKQMSSYYGLAIPLRSFNRIYNKKLDNNLTLRSAINRIDSKFEKFVGTLISDMQGGFKKNSETDQFANKALGTIRNWGARAALGMNLKVLANQFVSLSASASVGIKYKNIAKGFGQALARKTNFDMLTKYAPMLFMRFREGNNIDVGLLKDDTSKAGKFDKFMNKIAFTPISKIDQFVVGAIWNASLEQTKNSKSYEDFSEEHYKKAAELTEKAVIRSQANYIPLYRPELLRSRNAVVQLSTMFMSEPLQSFSLLVSSADKIRVAKKLLKSEDPKVRQQGEELLSKAKPEWARATGVVVVDSILLTIIAQVFAWLKDLSSEEEEEDKVASILTDFAGNYIGMIPFVRDIANMAMSGYKNNDMYDSAMNTIGQAVINLGDAFKKIVSSDSYDEAGLKDNLHKTLLGVSQILGIPVRNLENYTKGIVDKFSPSTAYKIDKFFSDGSTATYMSELKSALQKGDDSLADAIVQAFLTEEKIPISQNELRDAMKDLYAEGYNAFPKSIYNSVTVNGEEYALSQRDKRTFKSIYNQANDVVLGMIKSELYKTASSQVKAKAIKEVYDYYFNLAAEDLTGESIISEKDKLFTSVFDVGELILVEKVVSALSSDRDSEGAIISGTRKKKVQQLIQGLNLTAVKKYMLMGYLGYKNLLGRSQVRTYIQSLRLTKTQKEKLFEYSGY